MILFQGNPIYKRRFVRTNNFQKVIRNFINDQDVMKLREEYKYQFKHEDFETPFVYKNDLKFFNFLAEDAFNIWEYIPLKNHSINLYINKNDLISNLEYFKNSWVVKFQFIIKYSLIDILKTFLTDLNFDKINNTNTILKLKEVFSQESVEKLNDSNILNQYGSFFIESHNVFGFPFTRRIVNFSQTLLYEEDTETLILISKMYHPKNSNMKYFPIKSVFKSENEKDIEGYNVAVLSVIFFKKINEVKTEFIEISFANMGGILQNRNLGKIYLTTRGKAIKRNFHKFVNENLNKISEEEMKKTPLGEMSYQILKKIYNKNNIK